MGGIGSTPGQSLFHSTNCGWRRLLSGRIAILVVLVAAGATLTWRMGRHSHVILAGSFHTVTHKGHGKAEIVEEKNGARYVQLVHFQTYPAEGLRVCLAPLPDAENTESVRDAGMNCVGTLAGPEKRFAIPSTVDLGRFRTVVIWNPLAAVNFTAAAPLHRVN